VKQIPVVIMDRGSFRPGTPEEEAEVRRILAIANEDPGAGQMNKNFEEFMEELN
jgi:hypothetical protein